MAQKNSEYWAERFGGLKEAQLHKADQYLVDLDREYKKAISSVEKDLAMWYQRLADSKGVSLQGAKRLLLNDELAEFKWTLDEYIKFGRENAIDQRWMKELETASARAHISRLEAIKIQLQQQAEVLYGNQLDGVDDLARSIYAETFYQSAFVVQQGLGVGWAFAAIDVNRIDKALSKPWAADGRNFSDRIWKNKEMLVNELHTQITQMIIRGDAPDKAIKDIAQKFGVSRMRAGTLVMTESAFFASAAQRDCFNELDIEQYEVIETLDGLTCALCQGLDGKVLPLSDFVVGDTAPPFHPRCRGCTAPYFADEDDFRAARGVGGETYLVPSITYPTWKKKFVEKNPSGGIIKSGKQFGKKIGKHASDYGLDPSKPEDRKKMNDIIDNIADHSDEKAYGKWRGQPEDVIYHIKGKDVVVAKQNGEFVTLLKGGIGNARVKDARKR